MPTETISAFVRGDFTDRSREAEQLLLEVAREGRSELLTSERAYLAREMSWDETEVKRQLRRVNSILRQQAIAGRPEDREAALQECQTSTDLLAKESPRIVAKIEKLQAELNTLERDSIASQKRCEAQAEAVQQLRKLVPQDIAERVQQAIRGIDAGIGRDVRDGQARLHELKCILNIDGAYESPQRHIEFGLKNLLPAAVKEVVEARQINRSYSAAWPSLKQECEAEYASLQERLPGLQAEYDEAIRQAEESLDYYSNGRAGND